MGMTEDDKRNCCLLEIQETEAKYYRTLEDIEKVGAAAGAPPQAGAQGSGDGRGAGPLRFAPLPPPLRRSPPPVLGPRAPRRLWAPRRPVPWEVWVPPPTPRPQLGPETALSLFLPLLPA